MFKDAQWWVEYRKVRTQELRDYQKKRYWAKKGLPVPVEEEVKDVPVVEVKPMKMTKANEIEYKMGLCAPCGHTKPRRRVRREDDWQWVCDKCIDNEKQNELKEHNQYEIE